MQDRDVIDSWFPADLRSCEVWEEHFAPRRLPPDAQVTRFAPSPTGSMHLGGLYVALLAQEAARHTGGIYLVRVEDTDKRREVAGAAEEFERIFGYFGLVPDEGGGRPGAWGPYLQSRREGVYLSYVRELVRKGLAYPCFCPPELLARNTAGQQQARSPIGYYGKWAHCRGLSVRQAQERMAAGEEFTVRFRCPVGLPGRVRFRDRVRGSLTMLDNGNDVVILKSAEQGRRLPTYHFAHVVDDHLMRVTLVIRGEEWISSLPVHHQLHRALDFTPPQYAHIAPLMKVEGSSRRKLSKRKDPESAAAFYLAAGYPAPAVRHYLRGLANSRLADLPAGRAMAEPVRLEEAGVAGPMVDLGKLRSVSRDYIASLPAADALQALSDWAAGHDPELARVLGSRRDLALQALEIGRSGTGTPRKDLACWSEFRRAYGFFLPELHTPVDSLDDSRLGLPAGQVAGLVTDLVGSYRHAGSAEDWFAQWRALAERHGFAPDVRTHRADPGAFHGSVREVVNVLRVCVTGTDHSPDLFQVARALGEAEVLRRLRPLAAAAAAAVAGV
ncbi:glutamate--tRNA ligase [Streptomyces sp. ISL-11]|uniref:glutamate--tRNA ligase n=1 Tax=Streptomyces sp. ISL-11 TaxID=2819174 RepID=UPI001BEB99AF|nr:glutamate--tRNA ligase family protein [Streptomyces sp. ISL-11]MBT2386638.1 glutamate--tRNA ligase [Streptomyces sp. ISL-11]